MVAATSAIRQPRAVRLQRRLRDWGLGLLVIAVCAVILFPVYWMILTSLQPPDDILAYPPHFIPRTIDLSSYSRVVAQQPVGRWLSNSTLLGVLTTVVCLALAIPGAYALSSLRWRGRTLFGFFLLLTQMLPEALIIIPIYVVYRQLRITENLPALALVDAAFVVPIGIWILKNLFDNVPHEIREAALVDGAGLLGVLWRIMLPISAPGLVAISVVAFFYAWNEYVFAVTMITRDAIRPASVGLSTLISMLDTPIDRVLAAGLLFSVLPIIFYLLVQRYVVAGLTAGAVKG
jgi:multiple sugar transport system permease protein